MKKMFALTLSALICVAVFTGCGNKDGSSSMTSSKGAVNDVVSGVVSGTEDVVSGIVSGAEDIVSGAEDALDGNHSSK